VSQEGNCSLRPSGGAGPRLYTHTHTYPPPTQPLTAGGLGRTGGGEASVAGARVSAANESYLKGVCAATDKGGGHGGGGTGSAYGWHQARAVWIVFYK